MNTDTAVLYMRGVGVDAFLVQKKFSSIKKI